MLVWPIWCDRKPVGELWRAIDRAGMAEKDVTFLPYWQRPPPATVDSDKVLVSAYSRNGQALLVVSNFLNKTQRTVHVSPNLDRLGLRRGVAFLAADIMTEESLPVENGRLIVELPEGRARFVLVGQD